MTGRGIDQVLPHPGNPVLYESYVRDARDYVRLAERANGPFPQPIDPAYLWGDALEVLERAGTDLRIVNLETSITSSDAAWPGKGIHYRMHPENIACLAAAHIDCCCLANNHVLDWGYAGLAETLATLDRARIARAGAGQNAEAAAAPAVLTAPAYPGRVLVFSVASADSGVPWGWRAGTDHAQAAPGVSLLDDLSEQTARQLARRIAEFKRAGDITIVSIHWGGNWGYGIPAREIRFAHAVIEEGVDLVHGHSSHHAKGIEVYRERLILYGCGDFLDDYEGISGHEEFRSDLRIAYLVTMEPGNGRLTAVRLVPMQVHRFRLHHAAEADARWLGELLNQQGTPFGTGVELEADHSLVLHWQQPLLPGS